jgi:DNA-binding transcriptional LysR family regulator
MRPRSAFLALRPAKMHDAAMLDRDDVRFLIAVARADGTAGAARRLGVNQSTVVRRIASLEAALDLRLFDKRRDGYRPTPEGRALLGEAEAVESAIQALMRRAAALDEALTGTLRVSTAEGMALGLVPQLLSAFHRRHPGIRVHLLIEDRYRDLCDGEVEVALRAGPPGDGRLVGCKLCDQAWAVYASAGYVERHGRPATPTDLDRHHLIGFEPPLDRITPRALAAGRGAARGACLPQRQCARPAVRRSVRLRPGTPAMPHRRHDRGAGPRRRAATRADRGLLAADPPPSSASAREFAPSSTSWPSRSPCIAPSWLAGCPAAAPSRPRARLAGRPPKRHRPSPASEPAHPQGARPPSVGPPARPDRACRSAATPRHPEAYRRAAARRTAAARTAVLRRGRQVGSFVETQDVAADRKVRLHRRTVERQQEAAVGRLHDAIAAVVAEGGTPAPGGGTSRIVDLVVLRIERDPGVSLVRPARFAPSCRTNPRRRFSLVPATGRAIGRGPPWEIVHSWPYGRSTSPTATSSRR